MTAHPRRPLNVHGVMLYRGEKNPRTNPMNIPPNIPGPELDANMVRALSGATVLVTVTMADGRTARRGVILPPSPPDGVPPSRVLEKFIPATLSSALELAVLDILYPPTPTPEKP